MKTPRELFAVLVLAAAVLLAACGTPPAPTNIRQTNDTFAQAMPAAAPQAKSALDSGAGNLSAAPTAVLPTPESVAGGSIPVGPSAVDRKVIKNGQIKLLVADSDNAINGITQIAGDVGGYIVSSRVWYQSYYDTNYKYATITIGVPADQFENAINRLRKLSIRVEDENETGQDVTDQYVDLQAQLTNLQATRDRIRGFLDQAKNVNDALQINQQLSQVEQQIEEIQGKINYLSSRAAYSTITIDLEPQLTEITPTPTPTAIPTPTATPWAPGQTLDAARGTLVTSYQAIFESLIWLVVVVLPLLGPPALIVWALWKFFTRKSNKPVV